MTTRKRGLKCCECTPVTVTAWEEIYVEAGVVYAVFRSGNAQHAVAMGPAMALEAIALAQGALMGTVVPWKVAPATH